MALRWEPALAQEQGVDRRKEEDKQAGATQVDKERRRPVPMSRRVASNGTAVAWGDR